MNNPCTPRIYVACLASYNAGTLHGRWIDCGRTAEEIRGEIADMLSKSPEPFAEEWAIHDHEGFGAVSLSEYENIEKVATLAELIGEHCDLVTHVVERVGGLEHLEEAKRVMEEDYSGEWDSLAAWAEDLLGSTGALAALPESLRCYFDYEKYADDLDLSGDVFTIEAGGKVHVFWNR